MKRIVLVAMVLVLAVTMFVGCAQPASQEAAPAAESAAAPASEAPASEAPAAEAPAAEAGGTYRVGLAMSDLSNPVWAEYTSSAEKIGAERGIQVTVLGADNDPAKQIEQVESFIQDKVDAIVITCVEASAVEDVCKRALDAGIPVIAEGNPIENFTTELMVQNYDVGYAIGEQAAKWINEKLGGETEYALIDYPSLPVLVTRAQGIEDAITKLAPNAKKVAQQAALDVAQGMTVSETILQSNPNVKVFACIGDGGAIGANEAIVASGVDYADIGVFGCDATLEALSKIDAGQPLRMSLSLGSGAEHGLWIVDLVEKVLKEEAFEKNNFYPYFPVTAENVKEYLK